MSAPRSALPWLLLGFAAAVPAADWSLAPRFTLAGEYNSNAYLEYQDALHRSGGTFDATLPLSARTERTDFALSLGGHVRRYDNDPGANRDDETLDLSIGQTRERSGWKGSAGWTRDTTLTSELGTTGFTQANKRHNRYQASIAPQIQLSQQSLFTFGVSGELNRYEQGLLSGLVDYSYASVYANYSRQTSEVTSVGFGVSAGGLSVPDRRDQESVNGLVRLTLSHQFTERLSFEAYAGPSFARSSSADHWGGAGLIGFKYGGLRNDFSFSAEHALAPAGLGALTMHDSASLTMSNRITEKLAAFTTLSYGRSREALATPGSQANLTWYWRAEESLHWQWTETVGAAIAVSQTRQARDLQPDYADGFIARLSINWAPKPLF